MKTTNIFPQKMRASQKEIPAETTLKRRKSKKPAEDVSKENS